jgi:hypothetical protein
MTQWLKDAIEQIDGLFTNKLIDCTIYTSFGTTMIHINLHDSVLDLPRHVLFIAHADGQWERPRQAATNRRHEPPHLLGIGGPWHRRCLRCLSIADAEEVRSASGDRMIH